MVSKFPEIKDIVLSCLNMNPNKRPKAKKIKEDLWTLLAPNRKMQREINITYIIQWIINRINGSETYYKYNPSDRAKKMYEYHLFYICSPL